MYSLHAADLWGFKGSQVQRKHRNSNCSAQTSRRLTPTPARSSQILARPCPACSWQPTRGLCACSFLDMDPLRPVASVLAMTRLAPDSTGGGAFAELQLSAWPSLASGEALELRMALPEKPGRHVWPPSLSVFVNDVELARVEPPREGCRRSDAPIEVVPTAEALQALRCEGHSLRLAARGAIGNEHFAADRVCDYVLCVVLAKRRCTAVELLEDCSRRPCIPESASWELLAFLQSSSKADSVACQSPWTQPLCCPLTRERLRLPVRGLQCQHMQCFDLEAFLVTAVGMPFQRRWRCPVCDEPLPPSQLGFCALTTRLLCKLPLACSAPLRRRWRKGVLQLASETGSSGSTGKTSWGRRLRRKVLQEEMLD
eukprot:TRINITY_DN42372_c0_g1_i1.p1 TRINITY_DN42372_c0_g1~~TRINITY_DN42372_c0_g1_i1.p1  ORF type:complete len:371 (-),score=64.36 TRINITY_DN42372_c0_g1_i1:9-1121(-)